MNRSYCLDEHLSHLVSFISSTGQKQRVSLARAAYARADLVLLDDPLSALDAGTAKAVFENLIKSPNALFSDSAIVLVTHASHFLNRINKILVIVDGKNRFLGSWQELSSFHTGDAKTESAIEHIRSSVQEETAAKDDDWAMQRSNHYGADGDDSEDLKGELMTVEEREHGLSNIRTWLLWFKHAGGLWFLFFQLLFMAIDRFAYVAVEYWLARWTNGADKSIEVFGITFDPQTEGRSAQYKYLAVYSLIILISVLGTISR